MKKKFTFLLAAVMLLVFMMPSLAGWGQTKITNYNNIVSGKTYYIGATVSNTDYYLSVAHQYVASSATGSGVTDISNASTFVFEGSNTSWTIKFSDVEDRCLGTLPTSNGRLNVAKIENIATFTTSNVSGKIRLSNNNRSIQKNSSNSLNFGSYGNTQTDIWLMEVPSSGFSVTYKANGGTGDNFIDDNGGDGYESGATVTIKGVGGANEPAFSKIGYHFANWTDTENALLATLTLNANDYYTIAANTILFAQWAKNTHVVALSSVDNVTLTANYGSNTITEGNSASAVEYGTEITLNAADLASGYTFIWQITKTTGGEDVTASLLNGTIFTVPDYDITIGGTVVPVYSVTYDCNGGTSGCPENVTGITSGSSITLAAAPTKTGSVFMGWNDGTNTYNAGVQYTVTEDVTFTAQWTVGGTATILFCGGNSTTSGKTNINKATVTGDDNLENTWTITSEPSSTVKFAGTTTYAQVGTGSGTSCATSIEFTTTLAGTNQITSFSATFGCFSSTTGTVTLKVGETVVGTHTISGTNDFTVTNVQNALGNVLTVLVEGSNMRMKCYSISYSYAQIGSDPIINAPSVVNISSTDTDNEFAFEIVNPVSGKTLSATSSTSWISNVLVDNTNNKVTFTTTANETTTDRSGSITLSYDGAENMSVTINQSKIDFAPMPLAYNDGKNALPTGFNQSGLGDDYSDANSKLKFDGDGDYLILKLKEAPVSLTYCIKGNSFSAGYFDVQTSADGETYSDLANYVPSNVTSDVQTITHIDLGSTVRYIKWVFTDKITGNIGIGNIHVTTNYDIYGTVTTASLELTSSKKCTIYNSGMLTVTGSLDNNADPANLIIEDGGQLIVNNTGVKATVKKHIDGYGRGAKGTSDWCFIASPVSGSINPTSVNNMIPVSGNYDLYRFNEAADLGWENYKAHTAGFQLVNGLGYLYANANGVDLSYEGTVNPGTSPEFNTYTVDLDYTSDEKGWNLVGNPFTCNATVSRPCYVISGNSVVSTEATIIAPGNGVMVKATNEYRTVTFTKTNSAAEMSNGHNAIEMTLAQTVTTRGENSSQTIDNAIVSFNEGSQLGKFYFGTQDANLYIPMDNEEYAIVSSSAQGEMPINFKAHRDGQYTITVNPQEVEMGYMHLIDNIAGVEVDLLANPSYTFNARNDDYESRFRLVFSANMVNADLNDDFAFFSNGQLVIANEGEAILQVIDVNGRIVATESINGTCSKAINAKAGVYVLRLINGTDVKTQKIIVK